MRKPTQLLIIGGIVLSLGVGSVLGYAGRQAAPAAASGTEHCQYPTRPLNADGSCDNSDPACPETIKDPQLHGNCPAPQEQPQQPSNPTVQPPKAETGCKQ